MKFVLHYFHVGSCARTCNMNLRTCHNEAHDEPHHGPSQAAHELTVKSGLGLCCLCHGEALKPKKKLQLKMANAREWFRMAAGSLKAGILRGAGEEGLHFVATAAQYCRAEVGKSTSKS